MRRSATHHLVTIFLAVVATAVQPAHASTAGDFDADDKDEILLRHASTGEWVYYDLDAEFADRTELPLEMADTVRFQGIGDFDGDGAHEVLARDVEDQSWSYFDLTAAGVVERSVPAMTRNDYWSVAAIGDFDGDGTEDIMLRRHDTGESLYYAMAGTRATLTRNIGVTHNTLYEVVGAGDFNGDGHDDILLRHAHHGNWVYYDMAGARGALRRPGLTPNLLFQFEAIGDFNGDGRDDVMLRHTDNGEWVYYAMGSNHRGRLTRRFGMPRDRVHRLVGAGDFDGDGDVSPLLRHPHTSAWHSYDLGVSPAQRSGHPGMTRSLAWADAGAETSSDALSAGVVEVAAGGLIRMAPNYFDLEGKTVTFTPAGEGEYTVTVGELNWHDPGMAESRVLYYKDDEGMAVELSFPFPFAGGTWTRVYANANGNISFHRSERANWPDRDPWSDGTMRSVASAVDSRSVAGLEAMIAALWGPQGATTISADLTSSQAVITWHGARLDFYGSSASNLCQARLYPTGVVELAWHTIAERDGIVGLLHGQSPRGHTVDSFEDAEGDVAVAVLDIARLEFVDQGSTVLARMTLVENVPERVADGTIDYRVFLRLGEDRFCAVGLAVETTGRRPFSWCGPSPSDVGYRVDGASIEIPFSKTLLNGSDSFVWEADAVWWGRDQYDQVLESRTVSVDHADRDLGASSGEAVTSDSFEVFHYPVIPKDARQVLSHIYSQVPANAEIAVTLTDFRFDDLFAAGSGTGPINEPVEGIRPSQAEPNRGDDYGSDNLLVSMVPAYVGAPNFRMTGTQDSGRTFHNVAGGVSWITHEAVHRWAAHMSFRNPVSGATEDLLGGGCRCHWSDYMHLPSVYPVWPGYSDRAYDNHATMGGRVWMDNGDGTFTRTWDSDSTYAYPKGLSALDLYAMGMIPANDVPETFILRDVEHNDDDQNTVRATRVPVRIEDIISVMGPRLPSWDEARRDFRLGVYLLHEDGRPPHEDLVQRARAVSPAVIEFFDRATGGRMRVVPASATAEADRNVTLSGQPVLGNGGSTGPSRMMRMTRSTREVRCDHPASAHWHGAPPRR